MVSLNVLALNSGSSSLEFGVYRVDSTGAETLFGESVSSACRIDDAVRSQLDTAAAFKPLHRTAVEQIARHAWALLA